MRNRNVLGALLACAVGLSLALACGGGSDRAALSVSARAAVVAGASAAGLDLGNGIVLQRVRMVVRHVEVEGPGTEGKGSCSGQDGMDDHEEDSADRCEDELKFGPFLVDLSGAALGGGVHHQFDVSVPAGTYEEIDVEVGPITAARAGTDAGLKDMADLLASLVVDGTIDGQTFRFTAPLETEQEREGAVVAGASAAAITFDFDPSGWFGGTGAARLDPTVAANADAILANVRASLRVVHDGDHDGCDDDHADDGPGCTGAGTHD